MAYEPDAADAWFALGLWKLEGAAPDQNVIATRVRFGISMGKMGHQQGWDENDKAEADSWVSKVEEFGKICIAELPEVIKMRRRLKKEVTIPKWCEPCPDFLTFLADRVKKRGGKGK